MKTFRYKALGADGLIHKGITEASSKEDLSGGEENAIVGK